jgi:hypothetical protein
MPSALSVATAEQIHHRSDHERDERGAGEFLIGRV